MRIDICEAFETIPEAIAIAQQLQEMYTSASTLQSHADRLYVAILDVLQLSISWYNRKPGLKGWYALKRGKDYDRDLTMAVSALKSLQERMEKQAALQAQVEQQSSMLSLLNVSKASLTRILDHNMTKMIFAGTQSSPSCLTYEHTV